MLTNLPMILCFYHPTVIVLLFCTVTLYLCTKNTSYSYSEGPGFNLHAAGSRCFRDFFTLSKSLSSLEEIAMYSNTSWVPAESARILRCFQDLQTQNKTYAMPLMNVHISRNMQLNHGKNHSVPKCIKHR